ncbi:tRNA (adenosine(37)-N6)-threonylcarbamoyltransferase complex ATPase subunit type 1 TsaE [uncultured Winogradskyella sp.]|uniref:tRNA (adenosine(37)-N6)-threonylcarbamoyltransferase complex ATPase subunit type 1 TsaE n=1 Tax=uncultured Winogradskyella sp. TaxID=395353 RepID=UPI0030DB07D0
MKTLAFTYHLNDIDSVAKDVLQHLTAKTILFNGDMGAGKTTFIKALIKAMGSTDKATSPTFSIVNEYIIPNAKVYHFDFYRLTSVEEAYNFGIEDYLESNHWLFIEWSERLVDLLPKNTQSLTITSVDNTTRSLKLSIETNNINQNSAMTEPKF